MPDMDTGQTRARIDQGLTGEKVAMGTDPAAAPMETDSESGGAPLPWLAPPHHLVEIGWRTPRPETFGAWRKPGQRETAAGRVTLAALGVLAVLGVGLGLWGLR